MANQQFMMWLSKHKNGKSGVIQHLTLFAFVFEKVDSEDETGLVKNLLSLMEFT